MALNSPDLPMQAGERTHVLVTVPLETLRNALGQAAQDNPTTGSPVHLDSQATTPHHTNKTSTTARLGDTGEISAADARLLACDSSVIPAVLGSRSEPLDLGRLRRLISAGLRRALHLRDRGCAFPGCHWPPRHCQGHHVRHWADGGPTDLGNLVLLCGHHHRLLHRSGWRVRIAPDGFPEFIPPAFIDRRRRPRRNNVHRPLPRAA